MSIRTRLALTYAAAVALTIAILGLVVWWQFGVALRSSLVQRLETRSAAVATAMENDSQAGLQEGNGDGDLFVVLLAEDGRRLDASANAPSWLRANAAVGKTQEVTTQGNRILERVDAAQNGVRIVVAAELAPIERSRASLTGLLVGAGLIAALISGAGGWWLAGRGLRPIAAITAEAAAIDARALGRRLPQPSRRDELGMLARTLNGMLDRIDDAVRRQRAFVAAASHDLRTPLAALQTELELADRPDAVPEELRAALRAARGDAARLAELAGDLLQLATMAGDGRRVALEEVKLDDLVRAVERRVAPVAARAGVRVERALDAGFVRVDRVRMEQALANVLMNAVSYSPTGGEVEISSAPRPDDGEALVIEVRDRGPGVPAADLERIFEPFWRGAGAPGNGAGLGLATVRAAVEAHGGEVTVHDRPGGGAVVRLEVPGARTR